MGGLLGELGKKLADRWLTLLVLPGALFLAAVAAAHVLGHSHALDAGVLTAQVTAWASTPAVASAGGQVVLLVGVLAGAAGAGLAAQGCGSLVERLVFAEGWRAWPSPLRWLAGRVVQRRRRCWDRARQEYKSLYDLAVAARRRGERLDPAARHGAYRVMTRLATEQPDRPTWCGDRMNAVAVRLERDVNLDLALVWPQLWLVVPETVRAELTAARQALTRASTLAGWAVLYTSLIVVWWPAAPLVAVLAVTARSRIRAASDSLAALVEAAARLHAADLARQLGLDIAGPFGLDTGDALTRMLRSEPAAGG